MDRLPPDGRNSSFSPRHTANHQREPYNIFSHSPHHHQHHQHHQQHQQHHQHHQPVVDKRINNSAPPEVSGRFSPFPRRLVESPPPVPPADINNTTAWFSPVARRRDPPEETRFDNQNVTPVSSPYQQRRSNFSERLVHDGFWSSPVSSPLPIRKHYQNAPAMEQQFCTSSNTSPILLQRFFHQQKQYQQQAGAAHSDAVDAGKDDSAGKKRYASHIKFQLVGDRMKSSRHQSPEPPPRLSRGSSQENSFNSQSPLAARRNFLEASSTASPSLSRR